MERDITTATLAEEHDITMGGGPGKPAATVLPEPIARPHPARTMSPETQALMGLLARGGRRAPQVAIDPLATQADGAGDLRDTDAPLM